MRILKVVFINIPPRKNEQEKFNMRIHHDIVYEISQEWCPYFVRQYACAKEIYRELYNSIVYIANEGRYIRMTYKL